MSWKNNLQVYIDPSIKSNNKDLYIVIESEFQRLGSQITTQVEEIKDIEIPIILFVDENTDSKLADWVTDLKNFVVKIDQPNLSMFNQQNFEFQNFLLQDGTQVSSLIDDILFFIHYRMKLTMNKMVANSEKTLKRMFVRKNFDSMKESLLWSAVSDFEEQIYQYNKVDKIQEYINNSLDCFLFDEIKLLSLSELLILNEKDNYLPVQVTDEEYLFLVWSSETNEEKIIFTYTILQECFSNQMVLFDSKLLKKRWEKVFSLIPIPIVVFDAEGELIIHNNEFSKLDLGFKKCEELSHAEQITLKQSVYRVLRRHITNKYNEFIFIPVDDFIVGSSDTTGAELGIISSSIAHEINNPLAGVMAAIDYLMIDDVSDEVKLELVEMKAGLLRCKKLISTFLGFSQLQTHNVLNDEGPCLLKDCIEQSMELIRFRLIENNIQIQIEHSGQGEFVHSINPHVFSMIFYLILGDIVTNVSHHNLVIRKSQNQIPLKVEETIKGLEIKLPESIELSTDFLNSKLMGHLLDTTHMKSMVDSGMLSLQRIS